MNLPIVNRVLNSLELCITGILYTFCLKHCTSSDFELKQTVHLFTALL